MKKLSGNTPNLYYLYKDVIYSEIAQSNSIDNIPGSDLGDYDLLANKIKLNLHRLFKYCINPITTAFGRDNVALTSVYRNKEVNKLLGGVENSQHIFGYAADIVLTNNEPSSKLFNWCRFNLPEYHQLIWEYPERGEISIIPAGTMKLQFSKFSWVHISYIKGDNYKINSVSSTDPNIHKAYEDEKTFYIDNFTHKISTANQQLLET